MAIVTDLPPPKINDKPQPVMVYNISDQNLPSRLLSTHEEFYHWVDVKKIPEYTVESVSKDYIQNLNKLHNFYNALEDQFENSMNEIVAKFEKTYSFLKFPGEHVISAQLTSDQSILYTVLSKNNSFFIEEYLDEDAYYITSFSDTSKTINTSGDAEYLKKYLAGG